MERWNLGLNDAERATFRARDAKCCPGAMPGDAGLLNLKAQETRKL